MIELRRAIQAHLETIHPRVHFQDAPDDSDFPYLVFDLPSSFNDGESQEVFTVDLDGWDKGDDTTALETLMETVNSGLNKQTLTNGNITATFYLEGRLSLTDPDQRIKHKKFTYQARLFERG